MSKYEWKKTIFKPEDFEGAGQYIIRETINKQNSPAVIDSGFLSTIMMKVGYLQGLRELADRRSYQVCLIDMSDGLVKTGYFINTKDEAGNQRPSEEWERRSFNGATSFDAKIALCVFLNENPYGDTFRFATNEELIRVAAHQKWRTR